MRDAAATAGLEAELVHPGALTPDDVEAWRALQAAEPAFASPLLGVDFAQAVGAVRAMRGWRSYRRGGRTIGFLAHHRRPGGFARPIGAPFCDYHALVSAPGRGARAPARPCRPARLGALRLTGLIDPFEAFGEAVKTRMPSHRIVLGGTSGAYLDALWASSGNRLKNYRRYRRSLEKAAGADPRGRRRPRPASLRAPAGLEKRAVRAHRPARLPGRALGRGADARPVREPHRGLRRPDAQPLCRRQAGRGAFRRAPGRLVPPLDQRLRSRPARPFARHWCTRSRPSAR